MRIEISAGGVCGVSVLDFRSEMGSFLSAADDVIASFKTIKSSTYSLSGGIGNPQDASDKNLQDALDSISARIREEEEKKASAEAVQKRSSDFLELAVRVDKQVAQAVNKNKEEDYRVMPWLAAAVTPLADRAWYEEAWNWLCGVGEDIVEGAEKAWDWVSDTAQKAWDGLVEFYNENKRLCQILIGVAAIAIAVVVTVFTGGAAIPALLAMAKAAIVGGLVSAAIGGSVSAVMSLVSGDSLDEALDEALNAAVDGFCSGFMWGGIFAAGSQIITCLSSGTSASSAYPKQEGGKYSDVKKLSDSTCEQVHHMPADSINGLSQSDGSSILMETADHKVTASFDNKAGSTAYRLKQKQLIEAGKFKEAFNMDVQNIRSLFGSKYDGAIQKAGEYIDELIRSGVIK